MFADFKCRVFAAVAVPLLLAAGQSFAQVPVANEADHSTQVPQTPEARPSVAPQVATPAASPVKSISSITIGDYARFQADKMQREMGLTSSAPSTTTATVASGASKAPLHPLSYLKLNGVAGPVMGPYVAELRSHASYSYLSEGDELPMLPGWRVAEITPDRVKVINRDCAEPEGRRSRSRGAKTLCSKTLVLSRPSLTH